MNTVISIAVALPAAYAFSRYRFLGDKHLFFWLLTNRMAPPAVFALPFFQLYSAIGLFDTPWAVALAHCLFNVPLAVWILEGFMSGVPQEIDETAYIDGYSFPRFFVKIFMPLIASGIGVAAFFCFMFSWVELLLARTLTTINAKPIAATMTRTVSAAGHGLGPARRRRRAHASSPARSSSGSSATTSPRASPWGGCDGHADLDLAWMAWTWQTALFFAVIALLLCGMTVLGICVAGRRAARRRPAHSTTTRGDRLFISLLGAPSSISPGSGLVGPDLWWALALSARLRRGGVPLGLEAAGKRLAGRQPRTGA